MTYAVFGVLTEMVLRLGRYTFDGNALPRPQLGDESAGQLDPMRNELRAVLAITGVFTIFFFIYPGPLVSVATAAAKSLF